MTKGVYFYVPTVPSDPQKMDHVTECLAVGLHRLGVPLFCNIETPHSRQRDLKAMGSHLYVMNVTEKNYSPTLMKAFESFAAPHKVILCMADIAGIIFTPDGLPSLMTHENQFRRVRGRRIPWAFGLSERTLQETAPEVPFDQRKNVIIRNFRPSGNQEVRNALDLMLLDHLQDHFTIDREINANHNERLLSSLGCLAYGGSFSDDLTKNPYFAAQPSVKSVFDQITFRQPVAIVRWDSWRWWESLAAGCLTFHLDFDKYGFALPVMPKAWEHYIPIDLADPKGTVDRLMAERPRWAGIAANGRQWARTHYSCEAAARRLLDYVEHNVLFPA